MAVTSSCHPVGRVSVSTGSRYYKAEILCNRTLLRQGFGGQERFAG